LTKQLFYYLKGMWRKLFVEQLEFDKAGVLLPEGNVEETVRRAAAIPTAAVRRADPAVCERAGHAASPYHSLAAKNNNFAINTYVRTYVRINAFVILNYSYHSLAKGTILQSMSP
jgi:hypothetical protein